jgi:hypothetical protein
MSGSMTAVALHRAVRLSARSSALLFAAAQAVPVFGPRAAQAWRPLYLAFMAAHAAHFAVVVRYAKITGGHALFPGGRNLHDVGGWPTVAAIYTVFSGLAVTGWAANAPAAATHRRAVRTAGRIAIGTIAAMFVGTYLGQLPRSGWNAVPAAIVGAAAVGNLGRGIYPRSVTRWVSDPTRTAAHRP